MQRLTIIQAEVLRQAVADGGPTAARFAVGMSDQRKQAIVYVENRQQTTRQVSVQAWGTLWPIFQVAKRVVGPGVLDGRRQLLAVNGDALWLCTPNELDQALAVAGPDRTDTGAPVELRFNDSLGIVPLADRTFDPVLIYKGTVPPGVKFVGVEDQDGVMVILDGPGNPGAPIADASTRAYLAPLLAEALTVPGAGGIVISTKTRRVWAVTPAALESIIINGAMPVVRKESQALGKVHDVMRFIPDGLHGMADNARRIAADPRPAPRALAFTGALASIALITALSAALNKLAIEPHALAITGNPNLATLARDEVGGTVLGITVTMTFAMVLACIPSLLQVIGLIFSRAHAWALWLFWIANGYDIAIQTGRWRQILWADGFDAIHARYGPAVGLGAEVGSTVIAGGFALASSLGTEVGILIGLVMLFILWRPALAAVGMALNALIVRGTIDLVFAARSNVASTRNYIATRTTDYQLPSDEPYFVVIDTPGYEVHDPQDVPARRPGGHL